MSKNDSIAAVRTTFDDPFAALDNVVFVEKRDKRADYTGDIPPRVQEIAEQTYKSKSHATLPFTQEQFDEYAPMFTAAARVMGKSARLWKDKTTGEFKLAVGEARGRKVSDAPVDELPHSIDGE